ncbi:FRG domain-containing protein [Paenibacillus sp. F6_3S_P_1C]|uniref:FRG domain-containing protein n=1 Tax=Paenibacillus vandeheii TaxID=3035917 RepID=A0ABT8J6Y9_9BACL|nr:FRG domain-containing protein [Paenibacillus vandeheii]MDN4600742.1 FRG domain-containing protein [Paenibacillus vandeheii]
MSEMFGEIFSPENFLELTDLITNDHLELGKFNVRLWRGQSDIEWPLDSGAYRKIQKQPSPFGPFKFSDEKRVRTHEENLLKQARHKGYGEELGRKLSDVELLARLQHHGAATRFVDFSKNALVSLWFCVQANEDKTGLLLGLSTDGIGGSYEDEFEEQTYNELVENLEKYDYPFFVETPVVTKRIAAQHGVFLYSEVVNSKKGSLKLDKADSKNIYIAIDPTLKAIARQVLSQVYDIRAATLFPDIDGFSMLHSVNSSEKLHRW